MYHECTHKHSCCSSLKEQLEKEEEEGFMFQSPSSLKDQLEKEDEEGFMFQAAPTTLCEIAASNSVRDEEQQLTMGSELSCVSRGRKPRGVTEANEAREVVEMREAYERLAHEVCELKSLLEFSVESEAVLKDGDSFGSQILEARSKVFVGPDEILGPAGKHVDVLPQCVPAPAA
jgi:hypothetical protein